MRMVIQENESAISPSSVGEPHILIAAAARNKPRIAVVSLFLDKQHGSERVMIEWLTHLPGCFEIHVYSQKVEDFERAFVLHRIPRLPGPHLFNFLWWLAACRARVIWERWFRNLDYDLVFSSGADWPGADAICAHIVFAEYLRRAEVALRLSQNPVSQWPRILHRKAYYCVTTFLERFAYTNPNTSLTMYSRKTANEIEQFYGSKAPKSVIHLGIDHTVFSPAVRLMLRPAAREAIGIQSDEFAVVVVGNDWRNKGVPTLLDALACLRESSIMLMIISREDPAAYCLIAREKGLEDRVLVLPPRKDIEFYYAAADAYAGPSLQDSYSMPPAEAMACGMPVIVSASAGVSEIVTHERDGLVLDDPKNSRKLAQMIERLYKDRPFAAQLGMNASETARRYTWESNGQQLAAVFEEILQRKARISG